MEEGDKCPNSECEGIMEYAQSVNCTCHISPPCWACTNVPLTCNVCGEEDEETQ
jgi:hypothetical protein